MIVFTPQTSYPLTATLKSVDLREVTSEPQPQDEGDEGTRRVSPLPAEEEEGEEEEEEEEEKEEEEEEEEEGEEEEERECEDSDHSQTRSGNMRKYSPLITDVASSPPPALLPTLGLDTAPSFNDYRAACPSPTSEPSLFPCHFTQIQPYPHTVIHTYSYTNKP